MKIGNGEVNTDIPDLVKGKLTHGCAQCHGQLLGQDAANWMRQAKLHKAHKL